MLENLLKHLKNCDDDCDCFDCRPDLYTKHRVDITSEELTKKSTHLTECIEEFKEAMDKAQRARKRADIAKDLMELAIDDEYDEYVKGSTSSELIPETNEIEFTIKKESLGRILKGDK